MLMKALCEGNTYVSRIAQYQPSITGIFSGTGLVDPEKKYPGLDNWKTKNLNSPKKITVIGPNNDYIYLPLDYLDNYNNFKLY